MKFALSAPNVRSAQDLVDLAVAAEAGGWDAFFLWDHLHLQRDLQLDVFDPFVILGAIATATSRVLLGTMVTPLPRRRPWVLAKQVTTLDRLSNGRAVLGVGIGYPASDEFEAFGDLSDDHARGDLLDEGLELLDACLRGGAVRHSGAHYQVDADLHPGPVTQPRPPIWVAGMWPNRRPFRRAARWDGVVPMSADGMPIRPQQLAEAVAFMGGPRPGFDVVSSWHWEHTPAEFADAGATWLIESRWVDGGWYEELMESARNGPAA